MTWRSVTLADVRPMQTIRVNGRLAVRVHAAQPQGAGLLLVVTDLGQTLLLRAADQLLRLDKPPAVQGEPGVHGEHGDVTLASAQLTEAQPPEAQLPDAQPREALTLEVQPPDRSTR